MDRVVRLSEDFNSYNARIYGAKRPAVTARVPKKWLPPPTSVIKINCDAALAGDGWVGLGAVARNEKGEVLFAAVRRARGYWDVSVAECKVVAMGVRLARKHKLANVIV